MCLSMLEGLAHAHPSQHRAAGWTSRHGIPRARVPLGDELWGYYHFCSREPSSCFHLAEAQISHSSSLPEIGANFHIRASRGGRSWCRPAGGVLPSPQPVLWVWREVQHLNHISPAVGNHSNTSSCASLLNLVDCTYIKSFLFLTAFFSRTGEISLCRVHIFVLKKSKAMFLLCSV